MKRVSIYVPKCGYIEAVSPPYRAFKTANDLLQASGRDPVFQVEFVGLEPHVAVHEGEYTVRMDRLLKDVTETDLVIIPALGGNMQEVIALNQPAIPWIQEMHAKGSELASLCLGAFLLSATGLLNGRKCSTHWAYYNEFRQMYPDVEIVDGSIITDEGKICSSGGANAIWNLLLYLIERNAGRDIAILVAKFFAIDIDRDNQRPFTIFSGQKEHKDPEVLAAQEFIEKNYTDKITISELAGQSNVSQRSFERRFKSATNNTVFEYLQRVRIEAAKRSFEKSRKNVTEVMYDVGYTDTKAFRDVFKKIAGLTPLQYRNKYSKEQA